MNAITHKNITLNYIVRRTTKKKIYLRVKDGVVVVSATKRISIKEIESLIIKHFDYLVEQLNKNQVSNVIHFHGVAYTPKFYLGDHEKVAVIDDIIHICAKKNTREEYQKVLYKFFKEETIKELNRILPEVQRDFPEVVIPQIKVSYWKSLFGNYNRKTHVIKISSMCARCDKEYTKLVLYHEMCHIFVFNHSKDFYSLFERKYPDAKRKNFILKKTKYYDYI